MSKTNSNPFTNLVLDDEEERLEAALEGGEFEESSDVEGTRTLLEDSARRYRQLHTAKPVTLRINQLDLIKIKVKAKRNNIPYQTLLGAVLHDFAEGNKEISIK
jgi:predicted DNA binding CopG/RHH family protein